MVFFYYVCFFLKIFFSCYILKVKMQLFENKLLVFALFFLVFFLINQIMNSDNSQEYMEVTEGPVAEDSFELPDLEEEEEVEELLSTTPVPSTLEPQLASISTEPPSLTGAPLDAQFGLPEMDDEDVTTMAPMGTTMAPMTTPMGTTMAPTTLGPAPTTFAPTGAPDATTFAPTFEPTGAPINVNDYSVSPFEQDMLKDDNLNPYELIPKKQSEDIYADLKPDPSLNQNFLQNRWSLGIDVSKPKRGFVNDLRGAPPNPIPLTIVSPFQQPTQFPDLYRKTLGEIS
jgi:hypothetical protein